MHWELDETKERLLEFTKRLIELRREHPVFRRATFLAGRGRGHGPARLWWFRPDGLQDDAKDWEQGGTPRIGVFLNGEELRDRTRTASR